MGRIYTKTVAGRTYRYQRIDGNEIYLGATEPVENRGKIESMPEPIREYAEEMYIGGSAVDDIVEMFEHDGYDVSSRTVYNYMNRHNIKRGE